MEDLTPEIPLSTIRPFMLNFLAVHGHLSRIGELHNDGRFELARKQCECYTFQVDPLELGVWQRVCGQPPSPFPQSIWHPQWPYSRLQLIWARFRV